MFGLDFGMTALATRKRSNFSPAETSGLVAWYDPSDLSSLFQDPAGTIPIASSGDPIGLMMDKSGNGRHMVQSAQASRPTYETDGSYHWVRFDGVDDGFVASAFTWDSAEATLVFGISKLSDSAPGCLFESSENANNNGGSLAFFAPKAQTNVGNYEFRAKGTGAPAYLGVSGYPTPGSALLTGTASLVTQKSSFFVDGENQVLDRDVPGPTVFGTHALYLGRRADSALPFSGRLFGAVLMNRLIPEKERLAVENWLSQRVDIAV